MPHPRRNFACLFVLATAACSNSPGGGPTDAANDAGTADVADAGDSLDAPTGTDARSVLDAVDVATPRDVAPPPLGDGEPSYDSTRHALILRDDFDAYADIAAANAAYPVGRSHEFVEIITGRGGAGHAIRLDYGTPGGADDILFGPETRLDVVGGWNGTLPERAAPYTHFFFSTWLRPSMGSDPADRDDTGSGLKGFMFWYEGGRYESAVNRIMQDDLTRGPKGSLPDNATSGMNLYRTADGRAPRWSSLADGNWHRYTIEIYAGGDPSGHFGWRYWVDGALIYSDVDVDVSGPPVSAYDFAQPIRYWHVFGNFVDPTRASNFFTLDFDDWIAWTD